jgi:hypothetical protein
MAGGQQFGGCSTSKLSLWKCCCVLYGMQPDSVGTLLLMRTMWLPSAQHELHMSGPTLLCAAVPSAAVLFLHATCCRFDVRCCRLSAEFIDCLHDVTNPGPHGGPCNSAGTASEGESAASSGQVSKGRPGLSSIMFRDGDGLGGVLTPLVGYQD